MNLWIEYLGYLASITVAISLSMTSLVRLRLINTLGCAFFVVYGLWIAAYPVAAVNGMIAIINVVYLLKATRTTAFLTPLHFEQDHAYLNHFLAIHQEEIAYYFPKFSPQRVANLVGFYILQGDSTVGVFMGSATSSGEFVVELDYVTQPYRDMRIGRWIFLTQQKFFRDLHCQKVVCECANKGLTSYLHKLGFVEAAQGRFVKEIW